MMNSIHRRRRRPRIESVSFKSLGWVLVREVAMCVAFPRSLATMNQHEARAALVHESTTAIRRDVARLIAIQPWRQYFPAQVMTFDVDHGAAEQSMRVSATEEPPAT